MISHTSYSPVHQYGAEDDGLLYARRVQLVALPYSKAYPAANVVYNRERIVRPEFEKIIRALTEPLEARERDPNGVTEFQRDPDYFTSADYLHAPQYTRDNFPNSIYPSNRYPLSSKVSTTADSWNALVGDDQPDVITFEGASEQDCYDKFYAYAQDYLFGDGLPLVPPTRELVDEMLAATTRKPNEVIGGKFMMRKGVPTVEKVAINAVMAGAKPEYFPVILAAMEAYSQDLENRQMYFHGSTAGTAYSYLVVVSGAIAEQIGMNSGTGFFGSGNEANNTIGRAIRMCIRNIGHLWQPYIDTIRMGRYNDTTFFVVAENDKAVPGSWLTYREQMGWRKDQNVVTITSFLVGLVNRWAGDGYQENAWEMQEVWTPQSIIDGIRRVPGRSATLQEIDIITPLQAKAFAEAGFTTNVPASPTSLRGNTVTEVTDYTNGFGASDSAYLFVLVAGEDPGFAMSFNSATHGSGRTWKTQLITGATLTEAGRDPAPPAAPKNFRVMQGTNPGEALLVWDEPDTAGRAEIVGYEVTAQHHDYERWLAVPGGAGARYTTLTHLDGGTQYTFRVRAVAGAYTVGPNMFGFGGSRVPLINGTPTGTGANATTTNVYTNIDAGTVWGPVAGRGAIASITWESPGQRIKPTTPSEVFWIMATATSLRGEIEVEWHAPYSNGGSPITGWEYSTDNGSTWAAMNTTNGRDLTYDAATRSGSYVIAKKSDDGATLADGTTYNITVRARNAVGPGVWAGQTIAQGQANGAAWYVAAVPARAGNGLVPATTLP
ncbi:MAG: fibronectin type III domain-containing protein [Oscillospiraceae bacterium]|jgi:hypothetical protein|nr:fibronectin type III domain-containing protein [Oscillospiraceae bacterium]